MNFLTKSAYCYRNTLVRFSSVVACAVFISCGSETAVPDTKQPSVMDVPFGFPAIPAPQDNPLTLEKIELGLSGFLSYIKDGVLLKRTELQKP